MDNTMTNDKPNHKSIWRKFRKPSKQMFWAWIAYQTVKGTLTTSLIWIPLIWAWMH